MRLFHATLQYTLKTGLNTFVSNVNCRSNLQKIIIAKKVNNENRYCSIRKKKTNVQKICIDLIKRIAILMSSLKVSFFCFDNKENNFQPQCKKENTYVNVYSDSRFVTVIVQLHTSLSQVKV